MIERWFKLARHGTTVRKELVAGITTFAASWNSDEPKRMMRGFLEEQQARKQR